MQLSITSITKAFFPILFCLLSFGMNAQSSTPLSVNMDEMISVEDESFIFPSQAEDNKYYLDLEVVEGELSDVVIFDEMNEVVASTSLADVPANAFYELDLAGMEKGTYTVRVRTFQQEMDKNITIQ